MNRLAIAVAALLAVAGSALAGVEIHAALTLPTGETHTVDAWANETGDANAHVDGAPVGAPGAPELPAAPEVPGAPELPSAPEVPGAPEVPSTPELPGAPDVPEIPEAGVPAVPSVPEAPEVPETPSVPEAPEVPTIPDVQNPPSAPTLPPMETPSVPGADSVIALALQAYLIAQDAAEDAGLPL